MTIRRRKKLVSLHDRQRSLYLPRKFLFGLLVLVVISQQREYNIGLSQEGLSALLSNSNSTPNRQTGSSSSGSEESADSESNHLQKAAAPELLPEQMLSENKTISEEFNTDSESYKLQKASAELLLEQMSSQSKTIRSWGCNRKESPLIFVHIGKSGGGSIRARFAASALNFTREKWWNYNGDNHYYPMPTRRRLNEEEGDDEETSFSRGTFCSSTNNNRRKMLLRKFTTVAFEKNFPCRGMTPLGRFVGCPAFFKTGQACRGCSNFSDPGCYAVYVGHNPLGSELHWLTAPFLQDWWNEKWSLLFPSEDVSSGVQSITPGTTNPLWCERLNASRITESTSSLMRWKMHPVYNDCSKTITLVMDRAFLRPWKEIASKFGMEKNYAPFYASMPIHRTVIMREPFSWLMSRFFWHGEVRAKFKCDDISNATRHAEDLSYDESGWAYQFVLEALMTLCGEDCINRFEVDGIGLEEIEQQAESNLRYSFSVVGLLNETESFYDMVTDRIQYSNMSYNPHVVGPTHATLKTAEQRRCSHQFSTNDTLQASLRASLPHFVALERLYQVAIEVNRFQRKELSECVKEESSD